MELIISELKLPHRTQVKYTEQARQELLNLEEISHEKYFNNFNRINFLFYKILGRDYEKFNIKSKLREV